MVVHSPSSLRCVIERERGKGNAVMRRRWRGRRGGRSRTCVVLRVLCIRIQQHMACQRAARLVMVISLPAHLLALLRSAWLLCFLPPCSPSPPHDMVVVKRRRGKEGGAAMCLQKDQHTNVCTHTHWMQSGGCSRVWHTHAHTRTVGGHPSFHTTA